MKVLDEKVFAGRVAIVTGAGKGIGQATAITFAKHGASVILNSRSLNSLKETLAAIEQFGGAALICQGDVADEKTAKDAVELAMREFGRLDYAVNNAGISPWVGDTTECTLKGWHEVIDINLTGTWLGMKYQIPAMLKSGGGAVVNLASVASLMTFEGRSPYSASKWGVVGITQVAAKEFAAKGVRVNAVAPGIIETPLMMEVVGNSPMSVEDYQKLAPVGRIARPEEVANAITWLCSDGASYVTGAVLPVDGGMAL